MRNVLKKLIPLRKVEVVILFLLASEIFPALRQWGGDGDSFDAAFAEYIEIARRENGQTYLKLAHRGHVTPPQERYDEIHFSFDKPQEELAARFSATRLLDAKYKTKQFPDSVGPAASFENSSHQLRFTLPEHIFAASKRGIGDFSIFFLIRPYQLKQTMPVMKKIGILEGRKNGFEVIIREGRQQFDFLGLFSNSKGETTDISITTQDSLTVGSFKTILVTYEAGLAKLSLYMEGREQMTVYTTENRQANGTRLLGRAHPWDNSPVIIGGGYAGAIDETIFRNGLLPTDYSPAKFPGELKLAPVMKQQAGIFHSQVYDIGYSASEIFNVKYSAEEPEATRVRLFLRASDKPFKANTDEFLLPFEPVQSAKKLSGRFYQYKAELFSDPTGLKTPYLLKVQLETKENHPPQAPRGLQIASVTPESVTLNFLRNPELDVINGGRYHIYYGLRPHEPAGVIRYRKVTVSPFGVNTETINDRNSVLQTDDLRLKNRLQVTITNEMIADNLLYSRNKPDLLFPYPLLQKDVPYYFWVTACDNAYAEAPEYRDHESKASAAVAARPE